MQGAFIAGWHRIVPARKAASMQSMRDANAFSGKLVAEGAHHRLCLVPAGGHAAVPGREKAAVATVWNLVHRLPGGI